MAALQSSNTKANQTEKETEKQTEKDILRGTGILNDQGGGKKKKIVMHFDASKLTGDELNVLLGGNSNFKNNLLTEERQNNLKSVFSNPLKVQTKEEKSLEEKNQKIKTPNIKKLQEARKVIKVVVTEDGKIKTIKLKEYIAGKKQTTKIIKFNENDQSVVQNSAVLTIKNVAQRNQKKGNAR